MLLSPDEVKYFVSYSADYRFDVDDFYQEICYDIIKVNFKKTFNLVIFKYTKKWTKKYKFKRFAKNDKWLMTKQTEEFLEQLYELEHNQWFQINKKLYEKLKKEKPEYFL